MTFTIPTTVKVLAAGLLAAVCLGAAGCTAADRAIVASPSISQQSAEERLGIRVEALRWSADGYMLDFRYRVVEIGRAHV